MVPVMKYLPLLLVATVHLVDPAVAQDIPAELAPPVGTALIGTYPAEGVQIYACTARGAINEWVFKSPDAHLVDAQGKTFAKHYAGPTWEAADGSKIVGNVMETVPAPSGDAVPWLLLSAESSGRGVLAAARFVERVKTVGGIKPRGTCPNVGAELRVPYTAVYLIYKWREGRNMNPTTAARVWSRGPAR
jgi:hypothetical protein